MTRAGTNSDLDLFQTAGRGEPARIEPSALPNRQSRNRNSALWAAYGDALGWISELTDKKGLERRTGGRPLDRPMRWRRRVGGRGGVNAWLPEGCYSDDSQLRLATGRAISARGFEVDLFAKVELPVWLSYGLGGGRSTMAAASNLARSRVSWFGNTFKGWTASGGNGAAMRIQPHVWASRSLEEPSAFLPDVVRNTICTHSHPIGLLGSVLHAMTLARAMSSGYCPTPDELLEFADFASDLPNVIRTDTEVGSYWRTAFEQEAGSFAEAWRQAIHQGKEAIEVAANNPSGASGGRRYDDLIERLKLRDPARRGSGMLTAVASAGLTWCEQDPQKALCIAANAIGTDTDTIATMAGALLGALARSEPPSDVLDADLFRSEADRLADIAANKEPQGHPYPDILHWSAPTARADTLVQFKDGSLCVRGLGRAFAVDPPISAPSGDFQWQWLRLESGQTMFVKRREALSYGSEEIELPSPGFSSTDSVPPRSSTPTTKLPPPARPSFGLAAEKQQTASKCRPDPAPSPVPQPEAADDVPLDLDRALEYMLRNCDDDQQVGWALRRVVSKGTPGQIAAFTAALIDELRRRRHESAAGLAGRFGQPM